MEIILVYRVYVSQWFMKKKSRKFCKNSKKWIAARKKKRCDPRKQDEFEHFKHRRTILLLNLKKKYLYATGVDINAIIVEYVGECCSILKTCCYLILSENYQMLLVWKNEQKKKKKHCRPLYPQQRQYTKKWRVIALEDSEMESGMLKDKSFSKCECNSNKKNKSSISASKSFRTRCRQMSPFMPVGKVYFRLAQLSQCLSECFARQQIRNL